MRPTAVRPFLPLVLLAAGVGCGSPPGPAAAQEYEVDATVLENRDHGPQLCLGVVLTSDPIQCGDVPVTNWDWEDVPHRQTDRGTTTAGVHVRGTYDGTSFTLTRRPERARPQEPPPPYVPPGPACDQPEVMDPAHGMDRWEETPPEWQAIPERVAAWVNNAGPGEGPFIGNMIVRPGRAAEAQEIIRRHYLGPLCVAEKDLPTEAELRGTQERILAKLGRQVLSGGPEERAGVLRYTLILVTPELRAEIDEEFGPGRVVLEGRLTPVD